MRKFLTLILFLIPIQIHAESLASENKVYDPQSRLTPDTVQMVVAFNERSSNDLGVYVVDELNNPIESEANRILNEWNLNDTGAILVVDITNHQIRLTTSQPFQEYVTDSEAYDIVNEQDMLIKMQSNEYNAGIAVMIREVIEQVEHQETGGAGTVAHQGVDQVHQVQEYDKTDGQVKRVLFVIGLVTIILIVYIGTTYTIDRIRLRKRSQYAYDKVDKLYPDDEDFIENETWTTEKIKDYYHKQDERRSNYFYQRYDKLYPDNEKFIPNESWTPERIKDYYDDKHERIERSQYNYDGEDKLYPHDNDFITNPSWTSINLAMLENQRLLETNSQIVETMSNTDNGGATGDW